jgi:hypothetical protein
VPVPEPETAFGIEGNPAGVIELEEFDAEDVPEVFVAVEEKV